MDFQVAASTDRGRKRRRNEDRVTVRLFDLNGATGHLLAVADGVGGAPGGATASQLAVSCVEDWAPDGDLKQALTSVFERANRAIATRASEDASRKGMATTLVVALVIGGDLWVANVGDSRAYLVHDGALHQITHDHSLVAERVKAGLISEEEASHSPQRNVITRSLGAAEPPEVDVFDCGSLVDGDAVILCSDGLYTMVSSEEIVDCVSSLNPAKAARELVRRANRMGGNDNISVAIARTSSGELSAGGNGHAN